MLDEYYGMDWYHYYPTDKDIVDLLKQIGLKAEFIKINSKSFFPACWEYNTERLALTVTTRDGNSASCIYIDMTSGNPSFEQFLDAVYGPGAEADYRIIVCFTVFDGGNIADLVRSCNECGLKTYLVTIVKNGECISFKNIVEPVFPITRLSGLPLKSKVQMLDFWVNCFRFSHKFPGMSLHYELEILRYPIMDGEMEVEWNEGGLWINFINDKHPDLIEQIWDKMCDFSYSEELRKEYPDALISLVENSGTLSKIRFHLNDTSITEVLNGGKKYSYGNEAWGAFLDFYELFKKFSEEYNNNKIQ